MQQPIDVQQSAFSLTTELLNYSEAVWNQTFPFKDPTLVWPAQCPTVVYRQAAGWRVGRDGHENLQILWWLQMIGISLVTLNCCAFRGKKKPFQCGEVSSSFRSPWSHSITVFVAHHSPDPSHPHPSAPPSFVSFDLSFARPSVIPLNLGKTGFKREGEVEMGWWWWRGGGVEETCSIIQKSKNWSRSYCWEFAYFKWY